MLLSRLQPPLRAALTSIARSATGGTQTTCLNEAFAQLAIRPRPGTAGGVRWASHKAQGAVNKAKDGPGKRLGAKKSGGELIRSFVVGLNEWYGLAIAMLTRINRTICHPRQHHLPPTGYTLVSR